MGKRKAENELSENPSTKRNREYAASLNEEDKTLFNQQKALGVAIGRAKKKLYGTVEFQEAGSDKRLQMEGAVVQETIARRYVVVNAIVRMKLIIQIERRKANSQRCPHSDPLNPRKR